MFLQLLIAYGIIGIKQLVSSIIIKMNILYAGIAKKKYIDKTYIRMNNRKLTSRREFMHYDCVDCLFVSKDKLCVFVDCPFVCINFFCVCL